MISLLDTYCKVQNLSSHSMGNCRKTTLQHYDRPKNLTGVYSQSVDIHLHCIHCFIAMIIVTLFFTYSYFDNVHVRATNTLKVHLVKLLKFYSSLHSTNFYWTFSTCQEWGEGEGDNRGWDSWMVSPTQWTWVWIDSRSWWWTGWPGVLRFMGWQRVGHNWSAELNWSIRPRSWNLPPKSRGGWRPLNINIYLTLVVK